MACVDHAFPWPLFSGKAGWSNSISHREKTLRFFFS
jgi:hypothetical protein